MNHSKVIYVFLCVAAALVGLVPLFYSGPLQGLLFGAVALVVLAALMPIIIDRVRRARALPPAQSAAELRFTITLIAIVCPLTFVLGFFFPMFGSLAILLVPVAYAIRAHHRGHPNPK